MNKILLLGLFLVTGIAFSQKSITAYEFTKGEKSIIIYASATSPNKVKFTLKNNKTEILKDKDNKEITFEVFPFTEYNFKGSFLKALSSIKKGDPNDNIIEIIEEKNNQIKPDYNQDIKNIFTYFNALIITAFEYDTEPDAGILKYKRDGVLITKQNIKGSNTNNYFKRQAKYIRKNIFNSYHPKYPYNNKISVEYCKDLITLYQSEQFITTKESCNCSGTDSTKNTDINTPKNNNSSNEFNSNKGNIESNMTKTDTYCFDCSTYRNIPPDDFLNFVRNPENPYMEELFEIHQTMKKRGKRRIKRASFKRFLTLRLKEIYNDYQFFNIMNQEWFLDYALLQYKLTPEKDKKLHTEKTVNELNDKIKILEEKKKESKTEFNKFFSYETIGLEKDFDYLYTTLDEKKKKLDQLEKHEKSLNYNLKEFERQKQSTTVLEDNQRIQQKTDSINVEIVETKSKIEIYKEVTKDLETRFSETNDKLTKKIKTDLKNAPINLSKIDSFDISEYFIKEQKAFIDSINQNIILLTEQKENLNKIEYNINNIEKKINQLLTHHLDELFNFPLWLFDMTDSELDINDGFLEHITVVGNITAPHIDEIRLNKYHFCEDKLKSSQDLTNIISKIKQTTTKSKIDVYKEINTSITTVLKNLFNEDIVEKNKTHYNGKELKFENEFPIGFSSKIDFADMYDYYLYHFEGMNKKYATKLGDFITYLQKHQNDRLNFSPKDQVVRLPEHDEDENGMVTLKKETSSKILGVRAYTDFIGFQEGNRNGLVQFEVEKNVPLWTKRMFLRTGRSSNFGFANYVNFSFTWSKIEDNDKELQVKYNDYYVNNIYTPDKYVTFLDLATNQNASVNVDLNLVSLDFPILKIRAEINGGIQFGRDLVVDGQEVDITDGDENDTQTNETQTEKVYNFEKQTNTISFYPDLTIRVRPEERFGGYLRWRPFRMVSPSNDEFYTVSEPQDLQKLDDDGDPDTIKGGWLQRFELSTFYTPSAQSDSKFFFRYRYTNTMNWATNGFGEFQVGYLFYLKF